MAIAIAFFLASSGLAALVWRWGGHARAWWFWAGFALLALSGSVYIARRKAWPGQRRIEPRTGQAPSVSPGARIGHPYRAAARHASRIVASPVSGLWTATLLLACMVVVAVTLPALLHLPLWLEAEAVLVIWWLLWTSLLTLLLYRGWRISDDHVLSPPRAAEQRDDPSRTERVADVATWGCDPSGSLARVANDHHGCEGRFVRALPWGAAWAGVYALPLSLALLLAHHLLR